MKKLYLTDISNQSVISEAVLDEKTKIILNYAYTLNYSSLRWITITALNKLKVS